MSIVAKAGQGSLILATALLLAAPAFAADPAKQACLPDAKRLCAHEMHLLSRSRVRACLIAHMEQTSPTCHDFMVKARAAALSGHKPDPSTQ
jgi:hypothetical protein